MLIIEKNQKNKYEWILLPSLPSKVDAMDDVGEKVKLQHFQEYLENYEKSSDATDALSIFSECEEVKGSEEGGINQLKSHKKPYASRMVMSNKKP